jgi:hypothetical protein
VALQIAVVAELAAHGAERVGDRDVRVDMDLRRRELGARHDDDEADLKAGAVEVMAVRLLDRDMAADDAAGELTEPIGPALDGGLQRGAR